MTKIAVFVGSLRNNSHNHNIAVAMKKLAGARADFRFVKIDDLPHYNDDLWADPPVAVIRLKAEIEAADGVLFVTPEYNRSIPGVLKTAIDWGSRPWGQSSWSGKPAGIIGTSPGKIGSAVAQSHLRAILPTVGVLVMGEPEFYLHAEPGLLDDAQNITDEGTLRFFQSYLDALIAFVERHKAPRTVPQSVEAA